AEGALETANDLTASERLETKRACGRIASDRCDDRGQLRRRITGAVGRDEKQREGGYVLRDDAEEVVRWSVGAFELVHDDDDRPGELSERRDHFVEDANAPFGVVPRVRLEYAEDILEGAHLGLMLRELPKQDGEDSQRRCRRMGSDE